jgi:hypothetical protein
MRVDEISLTLPADDAFRRVAHLVLGGFAARLDVTFENLEDIELALDTLLERCRANSEVTVRVSVEGDELRTVVGPCSADILRDLERQAGDDLDLQRILAAVCDRVEVTDGHVTLTKRIDTNR